MPPPKTCPGAGHFPDLPGRGQAGPPRRGDYRRDRPGRRRQQGPTEEEQTPEHRSPRTCPSRSASSSRTSARPPSSPPRSTAGGSGTIIDAQKGWILTNNHVVGGEAKAGEKERVRLDVTLDNGRKVQATILGQDPKTDIALIKIQDSDLKQLEQSGIKLSSIKLGDSSNMEVGDWVLAIGAPFGLAQTVTAGIISATGRSNVGIVGIEDFIQTDAPSTPATAAAPWSTSRASRSGSTPPSPPAVSPAATVGSDLPFRPPWSSRSCRTGGGASDRCGYLGVAIRGLDQSPGLAKTSA